MKDVFKPFLLINIAGTVFIFSLALEWVHTTQDLILLIASLFVPEVTLLEFFPSSLKCCHVSSVPFAGKPQMKELDCDPAHEVPALLSELLFQQVH